MASHASFERHKKEAAQHEANVLLQLNGKAATGWPGDEELRGVAPSKVRLAASQQGLAVREYKEASRLRPRDVETKEQLQSARLVLKRLKALVEGPKQIPMRRFLAHYNLSLRYWDLGEARQAIDEAREACKELAKFGLPRGCAEHNLLLMMQVFTEFKGEAKKLEEALQRNPQAVGANYDLGIHFFDKRMMRKAEAQLRYTRDRAKTGSALELVEKDLQKIQGDDAPAEGKKALRMARVLEDIEDDLKFIKSLRELWCVEEDAGKTGELQATGVRDGSTPQLLPCLHCRYSQERSACDEWLRDLSVRTDISLRLKARKKSVR